MGNIYVKTPPGVSVASIMAIFMGLFVLFMSINYFAQYEISFNAFASFFVYGLLSLVFGIACLKGRNWARILYAILGITGSGATSVTMIKEEEFDMINIMLALIMIIPVFLLFSKKAKEFFSN